MTETGNVDHYQPHHPSLSTARGGPTELVTAPRHFPDWASCGKCCPLPVPPQQGQQRTSHWVFPWGARFMGPWAWHTRAAASFLCLLDMALVRGELELHPSGPPVSNSGPLTSSFPGLKAGPGSTSFRKSSRLLSPASPLRQEDTPAPSLCDL